LKQAAVNYWGEITLLSIPEGKSLAKIDPILDRAAASTFRPDVYALAFSPDGRQLASAGSSAGQGLPSGIVIVWDVATGKLVRKFAPLATAGSAIAWSPDGKLLAAGTDGVGGELPAPGEILVWDASTGKSLHQLKAKPKIDYGEWASAVDVAFSPDGKRLVAPASAGSAASPAGLILPDTGAQVRAWSVASGESNLLLDGFAKSVTRTRFNTDGTLLATAGKDHKVRLWDTASAEQKGSFTCVEPATALAFHPRGRSLAVGCRDGSIQIWPLPKAP
jgi:WD40 repeat protein